MKRYTFIFFALFAFLFLQKLESLKRDYDSCTHPHCFEHLTQAQLKYALLTPDLTPLLPAVGKRCISDENVTTREIRYCPNLSIYPGYISFGYTKYSPHLKRHLEYCQKNRDCTCYWPEYSKEAAQISDYAYLLFKDLIITTALSELLDDEKEQLKFTLSQEGWFNKHGLTIALIAKQLHFIDYYNVCRDVENYAISKYSEKEAAEIKDRLEDILEALYPKFFALYSACYKKHPSFEIDQEIRFMKLLVNDISGLEKTTIFARSMPYLPMSNYTYDISELIVVNLQTTDIGIELESKDVIESEQRFEKNSFETLSLNASIPSDVYVFSPQSDIFLSQGTLCNDLLLYKDAIHNLTQAIQFNPSNRDAYIERAMAYFEINQLPLALKDYESAKKLAIVPPFKPGEDKVIIKAATHIPENKTEFSKGLISGTVEGAKVSTVEFVPSIFSCCRGILNGLWAFVCSPIEVSRDMIATAYAMGEFISNHNTEECFQCVVPELKELSLSWDMLNDHLRGQKIGFIIGKYGVDIFTPVGILKGANKVRALKRANTMCTLESSIASQTKQVKILEESAKRAALRETIVVDSVKKGKILIKSSNVQYHVMQPKHAWDKVLKLSGDVQEDFKKVASLLEDESIFSKKYFLRSKEFSGGKIIRSDYQKTINGHKVQAIFETYVDTNQTFLQDTWVITK